MPITAKNVIFYGFIIVVYSTIMNIIVSNYNVCDCGMRNTYNSTKSAISSPIPNTAEINAAIAAALVTPDKQIDSGVTCDASLFPNGHTCDAHVECASKWCQSSVCVDLLPIGSKCDIHGFSICYHPLPDNKGFSLVKCFDDECPCPLIEKAECIADQQCASNNCNNGVCN
jgi:hypothetical protein